MGVGSCPPSLRCGRAAADRLDHRAVPVTASGTMTTGPARVAVSGPTGPDVLASASYVLPQVSCRLPFSWDIHAALFEALHRLGVGVDRYHRLRLATSGRSERRHDRRGGRGLRGDRPRLRRLQGPPEQQRP